jgi:hypothetical protein
MPSKPNRSALGFLAVFGGLFVVLALVRGCGRPRPADVAEGGAIPLRPGLPPRSPARTSPAAQATRPPIFTFFA